jgi:hypothetical protein
MNALPAAVNFTPDREFRDFCAKGADQRSCAVASAIDLGLVGELLRKSAELASAGNRLA